MAEDFVEIARFSSRLEAEAYGGALEQYDIPFLIQGHDVGMFGPGMVGFTPGGVALLVPAASMPEVEEILSCVVAPAEGDGENASDET
jgi:hypothetical protein